MGSGVHILISGRKTETSLNACRHRGHKGGFSRGLCLVAPNEPNSPGAGWPREIRSSKPETSSKCQEPKQTPARQTNPIGPEPGGSGKSQILSSKS